MEEKRIKETNILTDEQKKQRNSKGQFVKGNTAAKDSRKKKDAEDPLEYLKQESDNGLATIKKQIEIMENKKGKYTGKQVQDAAQWLWELQHGKVTDKKEVKGKIVYQFVDGDNDFEGEDE